MSGEADKGELWPRTFCAFDGCDWTAEAEDEAALAQHLEDQHSGDLAPIVEHMVRKQAPDAALSAYLAAVAEKCRGQAPVAGCSIDRAALRSLASAWQGDGVEALVCFSCACVFTRVDELAKIRKGDIEWLRPAQQASQGDAPRFLGRPADEVVSLLGLDAFLARYDQIGAAGAEHRLSNHESFEEWSVRLGDGRRLLCCSEDRGDIRGRARISRNAGRIIAAARIQTIPLAACFAKSARCLSAQTARPACSAASCQRGAWPTTCSRATRPPASSSSGSRSWR